VARITEREAQAWAEGTKLTIQDPFTDQDLALLEQLEEEVLARVAIAYPDQTTWTDATTTPHLVRVAITKLFVAWYIRRQYSENLEDGDAAYAEQLERNAESILTGIADGTIDIPGADPPSAIGPIFYPTDGSSAMRPTASDPSLGPPKFSMGMVF